jgi:hypothetical protein
MQLAAAYIMVSANGEMSMSKSPFGWKSPADHSRPLKMKRQKEWRSQHQPKPAEEKKESE